MKFQFAPCQMPVSSSTTNRLKICRLRPLRLPPELGDGRGDIGVVEVLGEVEAQHLTHADAHQGVAGKVEIELERVGDDAQPDQRGGSVGEAHEGDGGAVRHADDVRPERTDGVGQQDFLCQAEGEQGHAVLDLLELTAAFVDVETVGDVPVLDDGAGDELGEHDDVSTEIDDVMLRFHIPAVDVDGVGKGLEGVEADAQRQYADALNGRKTGAEDGIDAAEHEICILEVEEHPETARQRDEQQDETGGLALLEALKPQAAEVVDEDEGQHDREKPHLAPAVEHEAAQEQNGIFEFRGREIVQRQCDGQKAQQKDDGAEDHGVSLLLSQD